MKKPLIEKSCTNRGFVRGEFTDLYCELEEDQLEDYLNANVERGHDKIRIAKSE